MKFSDLLKMSLSSLWRRKLRTILTILGVIIGTASIVVMMSLGIGLNKSTMEQIESSGGLTTIDVYGGNSGYVEYSSDGTISSSSSDDKEPKQLTDEVMDEIKQIPHVTVSSGIMSTSILVKTGGYEANLYVRGMKAEALEAMQIPLKEGKLPAAGGSELELLMGNMVIADFYKTSGRSQSYWETGELPDIDLMGTPLFAILDMNAYWNSQNGEGPAPKKYIVNVCGMVAGSMEEYNEHSWNTYVDIDTLANVLRKVYKNKPIPGQPTMANGKPYKYLIYDQGFVKVDDMNNVEEVQKIIGDMGFQSYSNSEYLKSMQQQFAQIQAVLGGIGAVSLFVAAIGIANTMMMSIYERTKEIGIMKVLGCSLSNIRSLFLLEAAFIGLFGGLLGLGLSYGISGLINYVVSQSGNGQDYISYIPLWLSGAALGFAILIGVLAGLMPALRAMKLSALEAIRTQ